MHRMVSPAPLPHRHIGAASQPGADRPRARRGVERCMVALISKPTDAPRVARAAGLRYVCDDCPGITRRPSGRAFRYFLPNGKPVRAPAILNRIRALAIPPAWTRVWICPEPSGHLQATGLDDRGRKQYR